MMRYLNFQKNILLMLFLFVLSATTGNTQKVRNNNEYNRWKKILEEKNLHEDPLLVNGRIYRKFKSNAQGDPFLFSTEWCPATIYIINKEFTGRLVKYDIYQDALVLRIHNETANYNQITLNDSFIDSFTMADNRKFVHRRNLNLPGLNVSYVEMIFSGEISMIRTYKKSFVEIYNNFTPQGTYGDTNTKEYLVVGNSLKEVSNKRTFLNTFNEYKGNIRKYMRKNKIIYRKASTKELINLMKYCNALVEEN